MAWRSVVVTFVICACAAAGPVDDVKSVAAPDGTIFRDDYGYDSSVDGWLKFHIFPSTWSEARFACHQEGARLLSPFDDSLMEILGTFVKKENRTSYTGVRSLASPEEYMALDGTLLKNMPIKWAKGQPDNKNNQERCLVMTLSGMDDVECSSVHNFLCYKKRVEGETFEKNECGTFDKSYKKDQRTGSCYKFYSTPVTWFRAHSVCMGQGGHLAIMNSEEEAQAVAEMAASTPHDKDQLLDIYIGFQLWPSSDNAWPDMKPISYSTVEDKSLEEAGYAHFAPELSQLMGLPDNCGTLRLKKHELQGLSHSYCYESRPFVCEVDAPKVSA